MRRQGGFAGGEEGGKGQGPAIRLKKYFRAAPSSFVITKKPQVPCLLIFF